MVQPAAVADVNLGTLNAGQSVTITFDVTINSPLPGTTTEVCAQGTVSSSELADVLTDDPDVGGSADPTCTPVNPGGGADGTPPSVGDVALGLRLGGKIGSAPIQLTWTATDDISDQSALVSEVQLRRLKGALWTAWKPLKTTSDQFLNGKLPFWRTFEYRVRSQDEAGNWSGWAYSEDVLLLRRQERHFSFSGSWSRVADSHAMKGYMSVSSSPGDSASLAFEGNAAAAVMPANAALGSAEVCVDPGTGSEQCTTVDLGTFSPSGNKRLVAAFNDLAEGAHTLRVTVVSGTVKLDGAVLSQNPGFGTCLAPSTDVGPSC